MSRPYIGGSNAAVKTINSSNWVSGTTMSIDLYASDHGKTILIDHPDGADLVGDGSAFTTITMNLPEKKAGLEIKFLLVSEMDSGSSALHIKAPNTNDMIGSITTIAADLTGVSKVDNGSVNQLQITDDVHQGSFINCICDGSKWYVNATLYSDSTDRGDFAAV